MASEVFHDRRSIGKTQARNGSFLPRKRRSIHLEGARGHWHVAGPYWLVEEWGTEATGFGAELTASTC